MFRGFISTVLAEIDIALMQSEKDAERILKLGIDSKKVAVTGNLKFDQQPAGGDSELAEMFRRRFAIEGDKRLIIAASTHEPEERYVIESLDGELGHSCRLLIAPRHPERFGSVESLLKSFPYSFVKRSDPESEIDKRADIILLDTIGELRSAYPLAEIVFVGGSLIPHGGQSIIEPAAEGKPIVTGPYTDNFAAVVNEFLANNALRQTPTVSQDFQIPERLCEDFAYLLDNKEKRLELGRNAAAVVARARRGSTELTVELIRSLVD